MEEIVKILYIDYQDELLNMKNIIHSKFNITFTESIEDAKKLIINEKEEFYIVICELEILELEDPNFFNWLNDNNDISYMSKILISKSITTERLIDAINVCRIFRYVEKPLTIDIIPHLYDAYNYYLEKLDNQSLLSKLIYKTEKLETAEEEVKRSENLYRILAKNIPNFAVMIFDKDFKFLLADGTALDTSEYGNVEGKHICEVMERKLVEDLEPFYEKVLETGGTISTEHYHNNKWYESQFIPIRNDSNLEYDRCMIVVYETTNIKELSIKLESKVKELENINLYMDNFVYAASHDLKSPVMNLKALMNLWNLPNVKQDDINKRIKNGVKTIEDTLDSLIEIIEIQKNNNIKLNNVSIEKTYYKALKNLENHLHRSDAEIKLDFEVKNIKYVEPYLVSIIQNILNNSMKYYDKSRKCKISLTTKQLKDYILITIKDNGIGIDFNRINKDKIFEPFNRFTNKSSGRGIGLHLVKNIVEKNGGYIEVESEINKGTTFFIYLKEY